MNNIHGIVYCATNPNNGKKYIGQSRKLIAIQNPRVYWRSRYAHRAHNKAFDADIKRIGFDAFEWKILKECSSIEEMNAEEIKFIAQFNTTNPEFGYNMKLGGNNGGVFSEHSKILMGRIISCALNSPEAKARRAITEADPLTKERRRTANKEIANRPDIKERKRKSHIGRKHSEKSIQKIKEARKKQKMKPVSEETRKKMSDAKKRWHEKRKSQEGSRR